MSEKTTPLERYSRPALPQPVARELRQEAGFGCAKCGHPYVEYHHIIPFAEEQHFRPEDMIALCGNCHPSVGKQGRDRQYELKASPHNRKTGRFSGALEFDKRDLLFKVGGSWYENVQNIIQVHDTPIIKCRIEEGQAMVSICMMDSLFRPLLTVDDNQVSFRVSDIWDFSYQHNVAVVRYGKGKIALRIDFRGPEATIEGTLNVGNQVMLLGAEEAQIPGGGTIRGMRVSNGFTGIQLGDPDFPLPKYSPWPRVS